MTQPQLSVRERAREMFKGRFLGTVKDRLGWKIPKLAFLWQESGKSVEWEDTEKELLAFIDQIITLAQEEKIKEVEDYKKTLRNKVCDKRWDREIDLELMGVDAVLKILKQ